MKTILLRVSDALTPSIRETIVPTGAAGGAAVSRLPNPARAGGAHFGGEAVGARRLRTRRLATEIGRLRRARGSADWSQPLRWPLRLLLALVAFALPARAVDFYFNTTSQQLELFNGSPTTIHGVGAGTMTIDPDGVAVFPFGASIAFLSGDRVFFRGTRAVRIAVTGNVTIPAG